MIKKILHVIERFNVAGAEMVVKDLLVATNSDKWIVEVCVLHDIGVLGKELLDRGYPIFFLNWGPENLSDSSVSNKLNILIKDRNIDVVHAHNVTPWYFSVRALWGLKRKLCVTIHGFVRGKDSFKKKILYIVLSYFTQRIIVVSKLIKENIATFPFIKMGKSETIVNGVSFNVDGTVDRIKKRKEIGLSHDDFVIGTVGRLFKEKNIEMQLEMIGLLVNIIPNIKLVIVSKKYDYLKKLEIIIKRLHIKNNVIFTGLRRDIPEILLTFDVFVMSSFSEGSSIAMIEAMYSGLAIVVSDVGGNSEIVINNKNGLLFDVNDIKMFCGHIQSLYKNEKYRLQLGKNAKLSTEKYSMKKMVEKYENIYDNLID